MVEQVSVVADRQALAVGHYDRVRDHLNDATAKHSPVIVTILETLENLLAPVVPAGEFDDPSKDVDAV